MKTMNLWSQHREVSLNWLALGLLLAAWNAADNDGATVPVTRPASLRAHPRVSVRAFTHHHSVISAPT